MKSLKYDIWERSVLKNTEEKINKTNEAHVGEKKNLKTTFHLLMNNSKYQSMHHVSLAAAERANKHLK